MVQKPCPRPEFQHVHHKFPRFHQCSILDNNIRLEGRLDVATKVVIINVQNSNHSCFSAVQGDIFGGDLLTGGPSHVLQPMNRPNAQVNQVQGGVDKRDLDSSLNKVAMSIGE